MSAKSAFFLISILILSSFMILAPVHSTAAESIKVYVDPPSVVDPNVLFNVSVKIDNVVGLTGVQWELWWEPTLLSAVNMTEVMFHEITPQSEWDNIQRLQHDIDNVIGRARYCYQHLSTPRAVEGGYAPISGNHTIAIIAFQVKSVGNCSLDLAVSKLSSFGEPILHEKIAGFFSNSVLPPPLPPSPPSSAQVLLYADPHRVRNESLGFDSTFSVSVKLDSIANHSGMLFVSFGLSWNSTLLDCVDVIDVIMHEVTPQSDWDNIDLNTYVDNTQGYLEYDGIFVDVKRALSEGYAPMFGNHTLAIATFRVKGAGKCLLHLTDFRAADYPNINVLLYATVDGSFGNTLMGDLNGDNAVNLFDLIVFARSFGIGPEALNWNEDADINGDGFADIFDAISLCNCFQRTT